MRSPLTHPASSRRCSGLAFALCFLTRLGKPAIFESASIAGALPWFGVAGLITGILCAVAAFSFCAFQSLAGAAASPAPCFLLCGWLWLAVEIWLTRALHWDGVADLGDALGSGTTGEKFRAVMKDSRIGTFGATTLVLLMGAQALAAGQHISEIWTGPAKITSLATLIIAPAWARVASVWLAFGARAHTSTSLGALLCENTDRKIWLNAILQGAVCLLVPILAGLRIWQALAVALFQLTLNHWLRQLAKNRGGLSGDFFGCQIEASQCLFLVLTI